jgi:hypothetical protein
MLAHNIVDSGVELGGWGLAGGRVARLLWATGAGCRAAATCHGGDEVVKLSLKCPQG